MTRPTPGARLMADAMKLYRKTALVSAEQFLPSEGKIPEGVFSDGLSDPRKSPAEWCLQTLEGRHTLRNGDYICTGPNGEKWNVEQSIFEASYEPATPPAREEGQAEGAGEREQVVKYLDELIAHIVAIGPDKPDVNVPMCRRVWREVFADLIAALRNRTSEPEAGEAAGCAELEVGRAVYERIEKLIGATSGPEAVELCYLAHLVESVEEVGGYDGPHPDHPAPATADKLRAVVEGFVSDLTGGHPNARRTRLVISHNALSARIDQALAALNEQPQ